MAEWKHAWITATLAAGVAGGLVWYRWEQSPERPNYSELFQSVQELGAGSNAISIQENRGMAFLRLPLLYYKHHPDKVKKLIEDTWLEDARTNQIMAIPEEYRDLRHYAIIQLDLAIKNPDLVIKGLNKALELKSQNNTTDFWITNIEKENTTNLQAHATIVPVLMVNDGQDTEIEQTLEL